MTKSDDIWNCHRCGNPQGRHDLWFQGDLCEACHNSTIKIVNDFVWLVVTDKANDIYRSGLFELYILWNDGSESLVTDYEHIDEAKLRGCEIGIEVGHLINH